MSKSNTQVLIIWREFLAGVKRRSRLIESIRSAAVEPMCPPGALKEMLVELRQLTIKVVEDALEIEYRSQFGDSRPPIKGGASVQLPSIDKFHTLEKKEDVLILASIVSDADGLFQLKNVISLLPVDFPTTRNPLMLGKIIDDLAELPIPTPEPGNAEQELRALEFMRYKRASKALLKAEAQVLNKMPILLEDIDRVWLLKDQNSNINALVRVAITILNENNHVSSADREPQLSLLQGAPIETDPPTFLRGLNRFRAGVQLPADVQAAIRQALHSCDLSHIHDPSVEYIAEWVGVIVGTTLTVKHSMTEQANRSHSKSFSAGSGMGSRGLSRGRAPDEQSAVTLDDIHAPSGSRRSQSPEQPPSPAKSRTHGSLSGGVSSPGSHRMSLTIGPGAAPPAPIEKSKHKAKMMAEKADITLASAMGAAKKQDNKRKAEIARLKNGGGASAVEQGELNAIRYELIKMQQELLRRKILDPRHYKAASIDSQEVLEQSRQANPTQGTASTQRKIGAVRNKKAAKTSKMAQNIPLAIQNVDWAEHHGNIEVAIEPLTDMIVVKYKEIPQDGIDGGASENSSGDINALTMKVSKLSLHRLIGKQVDSILEANKDVRKVDLMPLFEKFMEGMAEYDTSIAKANSSLSAQAQGTVVSTDLVLGIDRELFTQEVTSGGVAMNVTVSRDAECTGLLVTCVPHPGALRVRENTKYDTGPVTLFLHDKELQVLLINQRGLYNLAQTKWSCMAMVAEWIVSRLHARRIPVFQALGGANDRLRPLTAGEATHMERMSLKNEPESSTNEIEGGEVEAVRDEIPSDQELVLVKEEASQMQEQAVNDKDDDRPMLLEVQVDRSVDIADDVITLWQARNVPNLMCSHYTISAKQDMEMLKIAITVRLPDQDTGERLRNALLNQQNAMQIAEQALKERALKKKKKREGAVRIYTMYDEDDEYSSGDEAPKKPELLTPEQIIASNASYSELTFTFSLTGTELLIFGSTEMLEELHKTSSMKAKKTFQASKFMRNILGRLFLQFKHHHLPNIYDPQTNVLDKSQWDLHFDRRLFRDVRTISGGVLIISASVIGSEILFDAKPTEGSIFRQVGSKLCTDEEIRDLVMEEGWPLDSLLPEHRVSLAFRILDTMKVVQSGDFHRLESSSYAESKMLTVIRQGTFNKPDSTMGLVEINEHHTLSDLRTIIHYELDKAIIPRKFAFNYKGAACAQRQEQFRKAWECLPKIFVISLAGAPADEIAELEKKDPAKKTKPIDGKDEAGKDGKNSQAVRTVTALIRLNKKLSPVPVPTMCRIYNDHPTVYLLHSMVECSLAPGDVLRFGSAEGSDYVIPLKRSLKKAILTNKKFDVDPKITGASEKMLSGNFPKTAEKQKQFAALVPGRAELGLEYMPFFEEVKLGVDAKEMLNSAFLDSIDAGSSPVKAMPSNDIIRQKEDNQKGANKAVVGFAITEANLDKRDEDNPAEKEPVPFTDVWLWKCIPRGEDKRPLFRRQYDAGQVPYEYKHSNEIKAGLSFFRIFISWRNLELFCTDSRCYSLSPHIQRVDMRAKFTVDYLVDLAYSHILAWPHSSNIGVDYSKFHKLVTECNIFSDIKKAARQYQLEMLFEREVKGPNGINNKYVNKDGLYNILQDVAIIRFPSTVGDDEDALFDQPSEPPPMPGQTINRRKGVMQKGNKYMAHEDLKGLIQNHKSAQKSKRSKDPSPGPSRGENGSPSRDRDNKNDDDSINSENSDTSEVFYSGGGGGSRKQSVATASSSKTRRESTNGDKTTPMTGSVDLDEESMETSSVNTKTSGNDSQAQFTVKATKPKTRKTMFNNESTTNKRNIPEEYQPTIPRLNRTPQEAVHDDMVMLRLMNDYVMNMDGWQAELWENAKRNAMKLEAMRYGACCRIQASIRKRLHWHRFNVYKQAMIKLQAVNRRRIGVRYYMSLYELLMEDWVFRARYEGAIRIQASVRRYNTRCAFLKHMNKIKAQEVILMKARRQRFRKMREKEKKGILFKETRRVAGIPLCLIIKRKDQRNYSNNYAIIIEVYLPDSQTTVKFEVEEPDLRKYIQDILHTDACNIADIMDRRNLQKVVATRLILRPSAVKAVPHKVSMSRQALGQRGSKQLVKGVKCAGEYFVCTVYSSGSSVDISCYHRISCKVFKCSISQKAITDWVMSIYGPKKAAEESEVERSLRKMRQQEQLAEQVSMQEQKEGVEARPLPDLEEDPVTVQDIAGLGGGGVDRVTPALLKPENAKDLYFWLVQRITVDKRHGQFRVVFQSQMEKSKKANSIVKIQALWRRAIVRQWIPYKLDSFIVKIQTGLHDEHAYYVNRNTGESSWDRSHLLKGWDLPSQPQYRWVELWYSYDSPLFVNPLTGKYTHLSVNRAAQIIQATARKWFLRLYSLSAQSFAKAVDFDRTSKSKYDKAKDKLSGIINYALLSFAVRRDERVARQLLTQAMGLADSNPVVSRLMAVVLLSTCEAPIQSSREKANAMFRDAHLRDSESRKFEAARDIFKYACIRKPKDAHTILNLGLVEYYVFENTQLSETLLRRAVSLLPFDERIYENWKNMRDFFPEKRIMYRPKNQIEKLKESGISETGKKKIIHQREVIEDFSWAGWVYAKSGATTLNPKICKEYWYNPATGEETFDIPNWEEQWSIRLHRSHYESAHDGMEHYYDPLTACYFQRHVLSETFS